MNRRFFPCAASIVGALLGFASGFAIADEQPRVVDTFTGSRPADAIVLFDRLGTEQFLNTKGEACHWPVIDGALEVREGFIVSKLHFRDAQVHAEFMVPDDGKKGGWAGNSGVYLHGQYELQILRSDDNPVSPKETVGAVYGIAPPLVNAGRPRGQWQVYDIIYQAPRRNESGKIIEPGSITAFLNGVLVQFNTRFKESVSVWNPLRYKTTPYTDRIKERVFTTGTGPLFLQDHGSPVRFRNVWIRPLDDRAGMFNPDAAAKPGK